MQLKLLNFHKLLSNIAINLISAFVPLIILEATGSMILAAVSFAVQYIIRSVTVLLLYKPLCNKPQLVLLLRVIPLILYSIFIFIIDTNLWVGVIGTIFFYGISDCCKRMPLEVLLNYSSNEAKQESTGLGFSRLVEQVGILIATLIGGFLLDIDKRIVVVISVSLYIISCVPLVIYYYRSKNDKTFNHDAVSNAQLTFKSDENRNSIGKSLALKILILYGVTYFVYCFVDAITTCYNIHLFVGNGSYAMAGVFSAIYYGTFGLGSYVFGKLNEKKDLMPIVIVSCIVCGAGIIPLIFNIPVWLGCVLFGVIGFMYASICLFMFQRLITKTRILGISNIALFVREITSNGSVVIAVAFGSFGTMIPSFVSMALAFFVSSWLIPHNEEKTRRWLVDYLQYNEVFHQKKHAHLHRKHKIKE